jgi:hypothetical protein
MELELLRKQKKGELVININSNLESLDIITIQKMAFIYNSIESGWSVNKKNDKFVFNKKHEGKKEVFLDSYLQEFIKDNMVINS